MADTAYIFLGSVAMALIVWIVFAFLFIFHIDQVGDFMEAFRLFWAPFYYEESYFSSASGLQIACGVTLILSCALLCIAYFFFVDSIYASSRESSEESLLLQSKLKNQEPSPPFFNSFRIRMMSNALLIGAILVILFKGISGITIDQFLYIGLPVLLASVALDAWALRKNYSEDRKRRVTQPYFAKDKEHRIQDKEKSTMYRLYLWCPTSICLILMVALCSIAMPLFVYGVYRVYPNEEENGAVNQQTQQIENLGKNSQPIQSDFVIKKGGQEVQKQISQSQQNN